MNSSKDKAAADVTTLGEAILASASDAVYVIDRAGCVQAGNERFWIDFGLTQSQSAQASLIAAVVEEEQPIALRTWHSVLTHRKSERFIRKFRTGKGDNKYFSIAESPVVANGAASAIVGIARDITEEMAIEGKLWGVREQAHAAVEYAVRASMGLIKGYIYSMQKVDTMPAGSKDRFSKIIAEEVDTMGRNIENLLLCRGSCQRNSEETVFDLSEVVSESIGYYTGECERRHITIAFNRPQSAVNFFGQPLTLSRIICNLIDVSLLRITHSGEIRIEVRDSEEYVEIAIADSAPVAANDQSDQFGNCSQVSSGMSMSIMGSKCDYAVARLLTESMGGGIIPRVGDTNEFELTIMLPRSIYTAIKSDATMAPLAT